MHWTAHTSSQHSPDWIGREGAAALSPVFGGELLRPGDEEFDAAAAVWNGAIERRPALIARATSAQDVSAAVRFAARHNVQVAVRGGGHNVAGLATCDDGLMIDLSSMNGVALDPDGAALAPVAAQPGATSTGRRSCTASPRRAA